MKLTTYVERLEVGLRTAAAAGSSPDVVRAGELLGAALLPSARLVFLALLETAAAEVTAALPAGSVELRLRDGEPELVVVAEPEPAAPPPDGEGTARITLRLPETLKVRAERSAGADGVSVNAWLVRAVARAVDHQGGRSSRRITGFARG